MNSPVDSLSSVPYSQDAEEAVIGAVLFAGEEALDLIEVPLAKTDFFMARNGVVWGAINALAADGRAVDVITVVEWLRDKGQLDAAEGAEHVGALTIAAPAASNIDAYAAVVRHMAIRRRGIKVAGDVMALARSGETDGADDFAAQAEQLVFGLSAGTVGGWEHIGEVAARSMGAVDELINGDRSLVGLSTGFEALDEITLGFQDGDLVILGARPSMGKTQLAVDIMGNVMAAGGGVGMFSLEMPAEQIFTRLAAGASTTQLMRVRQGALNHQEQERFFSAGATLANSHCWIDDTPGLTASELRRRARQLAGKARMADVPLRLLVVDYLQLAEGSSGGHNRTNDVAEISRALKATAKDLGVPVLALSQLNRELEKRPDKRPKMADLRDSGAIEQDADVILFLYRGAVYDDDADPFDAEVEVAKQRNGPTGTAHLRWVPQVPRFAT